MALNINGTTGISGVDGSVSAPAVTGTDSNTGITFPSADTIKFSTGGVERISITNSGISGTGILTTGGKILQVVNSQSSSNKTTSGDTVLALTSVTITPSATSSKVLVFFTANVSIFANSKAECIFRLYRGDITGTFLGGHTGGAATSTNERECFGLQYQDSPNTTSATTYTLALRRKDSNTSYATTDSSNYAVTALEIGA